MNKLIASMPVLWASLGGAALSENTGVSLGLFIAGVAATIGLVWWARGDRDAMLQRLKRLEQWREKEKERKAKEDTDLAERIKRFHAYRTQEEETTGQS